MTKGRKIIAAIILLYVVYLIFARFDLIPSLNIFQAKQVLIDETPILIKEIKSIGQLITYTSFDEVVEEKIMPTRGSRFVKSFNRLSPVAVLPSADKQIVLIVRGKVLAGTDLTLLTDSSIIIRNDTLSLFLPKPQIMDAIVNPSDIETFVEKGEWSNDEVIKIKVTARKKIVERALRQKILEKAGNKSKAVMENFLQNMGYKKVFVF